MVYRSFSVGELDAVLENYPDLVQSFDCFAWLTDTRNIALQEEDSFGLFEWTEPDIYIGHYFFNVHGKDAIDLAERMLDKMFSEHKAKVIHGMTPKNNKAALWITRRLGFKSLGDIELPQGTCELFYKTAPEPLEE